MPLRTRTVPLCRRLQPWRWRLERSARRHEKKLGGAVLRTHWTPQVQVRDRATNRWIAPRTRRRNFCTICGSKHSAYPKSRYPCVGICAGGTWPNYILEVRHDVEARIEPYVIVRLQNCFASLDAWRARCE